MKINLVAVQDNLFAVGVRRIAASIRLLNSDTHLHHILLANSRKFKELVCGRYCDKLDEAEALRIAEPIADADIVAFSSYTDTAEQTKSIIAQVRRVNPGAYIVWGGIHPIMDSEDAIQHADAICTGEGEFAFTELFESFSAGRDATSTRNFWFNRDGEIIRNGFRPLMTSAELDALPLPVYGEGEVGYLRSTGHYKPLSKWDYINYMGLCYQTVWTVGCPFRCTFCGNTRFLDNDPTYARLRHPSPERLAEEINAARRVQPFIRFVVFNDDSFLSLPMKQLEEFSAVYKARVGLPFCVLGVIPNYVRREKIELLLEAGLNRVRMGIQSGSRRMLEFYQRPSPPDKVMEAARILADYSRYMIPPGYDFILDNPVETRQDVLDTLRLMYELPRPYTPNLFSLRIMPNTEMAKQIQRGEIPFDHVKQRNYRFVAPTFANCLIAAQSLVRPPRWLFNRLCDRVRAPSDDQPQYNATMFVLRVLLLMKQAMRHIRVMEFSIIPGPLTWALDRIGLVRFWNRYCVRRFKRTEKGTEKGTFYFSWRGRVERRFTSPTNACSKTSSSSRPLRSDNTGPTQT